jgi:hypothetical protein
MGIDGQWDEGLRPDLHGIAGALFAGDIELEMDRGSHSEEVTFDQVDELARWLCMLNDPGGIWAAQDESVRLFFRKEAARRLQQARYKEISETI